MKNSEEAIKEICEENDFKGFQNRVNQAQSAINDLDDMNVGDLYDKAFAITIRKMQETGAWMKGRPVNEVEIGNVATDIWDACRSDNQDICAVVSDHYDLMHQAYCSNDDEDGISYILDNAGDIELAYHELFDN